MRLRRLSQFAAIVVLFVFVTGSGFAQESKTDSSQSAQKADQNGKEQDPLKRELSPQQKKKNEKALKQELSKEYRDWLDKDVAWIITDEERDTFKRLSNDEEREQFIEQFWLRRDPTPDTVENEYREEHYRRIAYANEHFASGIPGWKTDRGRIYIQYGPPDSIDSHPSGGLYNRPTEEGGGTTSTFPFETWRYRYLEGQDLGQEVEIEFVDTCMCGEYHMTMDRSEKDALKNVPGAGLTTLEEMGITQKADRFVGGGVEQLGRNIHNLNVVNPNDEFGRLSRFAALNKPPAVKFHDLEEVVTHKIRYNLMPFDVRTDFVKVTSDTILVPVTIQVKNRDMTFQTKDGVARGTVNIFGRVTTVSDRIAQTFEDTVQVEVPADLLEKTINNSSVYWKALPLRHGRYKMDIVVKDVNGDRVGTWTRGIVVPDMSDDRGLTNSTLILADQMEKVPSRNVGTGNFVLGTTRVRPRIEPSDGKPASFKRNERLNLWMQVYNLQVDEKTNKSDAVIEYDVVNTQTNKSVVKTTETTAQLGSNGDQITLERVLPLTGLEPGTYQVTIKVNDNLAKQTIAPTAKFIVE